ncbi:hypothetical protein ACK9YZ_22965 [Rhizobium sp. ZK1]|uniref:hypothetical protein n=1 Tax=Rhizobium sp. ZK1 TaxID=3389872 RepID=UPI0039F6C978
MKQQVGDVTLFHGRLNTVLVSDVRVAPVTVLRCAIANVILVTGEPNAAVIELWNGNHPISR